MAMVDNVVFDVGRVLIDFQYGAFFDLLQGRGAGIASVEDFIDRVDLHRYEHGEMSSDEFLGRVNGLLSEPLPPTELAAAWNDLFSPIQEMFELAALLKPHCGVYLLSNTSELHWQHLIRTFALDQISHGQLASYQVGAMKPAPEIFSAACQRFGLQPERTVFIDDLEANVQGARDCGWHGVWHRDIPATKTAVQLLTGLSL